MQDTGYRLSHLELRQLSSEQRTVMDQPFDRNVVVEGGPGTGKTTLAVQRAEMLVTEGYSTLVLVYSRPLMRFIQNSQPKTNWETVEFYTLNADGTKDYHEFNSEYTVSTYLSWLNSLYWQRFGRGYPVLDNSDPDWETIEKELTTLGRIYDQIIVDEGQDFPVPLLRSLKSLASTVMVFMDPQQAIEKTKTAASVAAYILDASTYHLGRNFRSTKEISEFSNLFRVKQDAEADWDSSGQLPAVITCSSYEDQVNKMLEIIRAFNYRSVGIILDTRPAKKLYEIMKKRLDGKAHVQLYEPHTYRDFDFDRNEVKIITYGTAKGLEFDVVILPQITRVSATGDFLSDITRIHIAASRAKKALFLFRVVGENTDSTKWIDVLNPLLGNESKYRSVY